MLIIILIIINYNIFHKTGDRSYLNAFGKLRFQNELHELRRKLGSEWYEKLNEIEEIVLNSGRLQTSLNNEHTKVCNISMIKIIHVEEEMN